MAEYIGMMHSAYFVGKHEILTWINDRLQLRLSSIAEAASGAVHCQLIDMACPKAVPMHKVNFDAKSDSEKIQNYKILQDVFTKLEIDKPFDINKLIKGQPVETLEFLQWLKFYCDFKNGGIMNENYDPVERRSRSGKQKSVEGSNKISKSLQINNNQSPSNTNLVAFSKASGSKLEETAEVQTFSKELADLRLSVGRLQKERDLYHFKLRDINSLLGLNPEFENIPIVVAVKKILDATDANRSALDVAQEYLNQFLGVQAKDEGDREQVQEEKTRG